jgi:hypothetical protein
VVGKQLIAFTMDTPLLNENYIGNESGLEHVNPLGVESFTNAIKKRKFAEARETFSDALKVKILDDFSKIETEEVDGSTSTRYSFVVHYDRWKCLAAAYYLMFCFGLISYFPKYSNQIRDSMQLSQTDLGWLSTFGIVGLSAYPVPGIFVDTSAPSTNAFIGVVLGAIGYFGSYLTTNRSFGDLSVKWVLYFFYFLMNHGMAWIDLTVCTAVVNNFPSNKGIVQGLVLSQAGLASLCMLVIDRGFFGEQDFVDEISKQMQHIVSCKENRYVAENLIHGDIDYHLKINITYNNYKLDTSSSKKQVVTILMVLGLIMLSVGSIASHFLRFPHKNALTNNKLRSGGKRKIYLVYGVAFVTLVYCTVESILNYIHLKNNSTKSSGGEFLFAIGLILISTMPFLLILRTKRNMGKLNRKSNLEDNQENSISITDKASHNDDDKDNSNDTLDALDDLSIVNSSTHYRNFTFVEALTSIEFWLLIVTMFGGIGNGSMIQYQLSQIITSVGGNEIDLSFYLMVVVVVQCIARIVFGSLQDKLQTKCGVSRPLLMFFIIFIFGGGSQLILAYSYYNQHLVLIGISLSYASFGATWTVIGALTSDIVGPSNFGKIYSFVCLGGIGGAIFNSIAANNFENEYLKNGNNTKHVCCGYECYQSTFITAGIITFVLSLAPLALHVKTRKFYKNLQKRSV